MIGRFTQENFSASRGVPTEPGCCVEKELIVDERMFKITLWDTAGQDKYSMLTSFFYRGAKAALVIFDVTRATSFWRAVDLIKELADQAEMIPVIALVANKTDAARRDVPAEVFNTVYDVSKRKSMRRI